MSFLTKKKKRNLIIISSIILTLALISIAFFIYVGSYYRADMNEVNAFLDAGETEYKALDNGSIVFEPDGAKAGFIFYPGGKVEYTAYIPLMQACADRGILCVLVKMPFNLAVLDKNAADGITEDYPDIESWYIGGHSLGGAMAASYAYQHSDEFDGVILLGAYSSKDLGDINISVLSIFGSEDEVLNKEKYDKNKDNLPTDFTEHVIEGGCHAYFGMYGTQKGDGTPTITNREQIIITATLISEWIK